MKPELVVALDLPDTAGAVSMCHALPPEVVWCKIGMELFTADGIAPILAIQAAGKSVFLDLKLHDIPRTVAAAVKAAARHRVGLLTVHAHGGRDMLRAAADAARESGPSAPRLLAVTTLTSLNDADLRDLGISRSVADHSRALADLAIASGIDGLVCSAHEVAEFRRSLGPEPLLVVPGIRPAGGDVGDQKRVGTPADAVRGGASHLVVGRPIVAATDPAASARAILCEMYAKTREM